MEIWSRSWSRTPRVATRLVTNRGDVNLDDKVLWLDTFLLFSPRVGFKLHLLQSNLILYQCLQHRKDRYTHKPGSTIEGAGKHILYGLCHGCIIAHNNILVNITAFFLLLVT